MMRDWSEESRSATLQELDEEGAVWVKFLTERSYEIGRLDPGGEIRAAVGHAVDDHWTGRMVDLVSFGEGMINSWRISMSMLVGDCMEAELEHFEDHDRASLDSTLREVAPYDGGPDIFVVLCSPTLRAPRRLAPGSKQAMFLIGTVGGVPSVELDAFARASGGSATPLLDKADAAALGAEFCRRFYALARSRPVDFSLCDRPRGRPSGTTFDVDDDLVDLF